MPLRVFSPEDQAPDLPWIAHGPRRFRHWRTLRNMAKTESNTHTRATTEPIIEPSIRAFMARFLSFPTNTAFQNLTDEPLGLSGKRCGRR